jgi:hypothetical protein
MTVSLPLTQMSVREKMDLIEVILDDLSGKDAEISLPQWHAELLQERQARIDRGEERFTDWGTAKAEIRQRCHTK